MTEKAKKTKGNKSQKKENWTIITDVTIFQGFPKKRKAEKYAKEKGLVVLEVVKLSDA